MESFLKKVKLGLTDEVQSICGVITQKSHFVCNFPFQKEKILEN